MLIQNWMTSDVISVTPQTPLLKLSKLMRDNHIRRVPVLDENNKVVGIISDRDVRDASPSKATTLDMHEMNYLLAELKAKDIMSADPLTVNPTDTVEQAAMIMLDHKYNGLPVVDDSGRLVGILSEQDVFKAFVDITGARESRLQLGIEIETAPGSLKPVFDVLRAHNARILSVLTGNMTENKRDVFILLRGTDDKTGTQALLDAMEKVARVLYCSEK